MKPPVEFEGLRSERERERIGQGSFSNAVSHRSGFGLKSCLALAWIRRSLHWCVLAEPELRLLRILGRHRLLRMLSFLRVLWSPRRLRLLVLRCLPVLRVLRFLRVLWLLRLLRLRVLRFLRFIRVLRFLRVEQRLLVHRLALILAGSLAAMPRSPLRSELALMS